MKIYLDDQRCAPDGWVRCYYPNEAIQLFRCNKAGTIDEISLDHDLGEIGDYARTGKDVLYWMFDQVVNNPNFILPIIHIHTDNGKEMEMMRLTVNRMNEIYQGRQQESDENDKGKV